MNPNPGVQRYLMAVEYIGTRFSDAQKQPMDRTVVGVLEEAFSKFVGKPVSVLCSSRTDVGVHALSNVCHVDVERVSKRRPGEVLSPHDHAVVKRVVNHFLQRACKILSGCHDFSSFREASCQVKSPIRTLDELSVTEVFSTPYFPSSMEIETSWHLKDESSGAVSTNKSNSNIIAYNLN